MQKIVIIFRYYWCFFMNFWTPVHCAAQSSLSSLLDPLVLNGSEINEKAKDGSTPLHIAAKHNSIQFTMSLIGFGAILDSQDNNGSTPLHIAITHSHFSVAKLLIQSGADQNIRNISGQTPADTAPVPMINQTRAFFANWENWDEMTDSISFKK